MGLWGPLSVQPELLITPKGYHNVSVDRRATYLEVPLLLRIDGGFGRIDGFLLAGASGGMELRCRETRRTSAGEVRANCDAYPGGGTRPFELVPVVGAGLTLQIGRGRIVLDFRGGVGATDIHRGADHKERNETIAVTMGYSIPLIRR
jgi:hypothetical protein